ncbi:beta-defensin 119 [Pipistrellus kuhlii]|uniref:Defensin beta 119 n=1 Tax=Pipistrellus kuhlii TaxID=59472 RepID=A0A7J7Y811_PIPKU|nr:beta-defensin 119 [Pipistrellus kuhlii]KAF6358091.1 defensin beta 119 [Pipistrellus kuhlii]
MRALLLLVILLAIQPEVSGRQHVLHCMGNMGICRSSCKKTEQPYLYCRNYKTCCLQSYMKINVISKEDRHEQNKVARWPKIP